MIVSESPHHVAAVRSTSRDHDYHCEACGYGVSRCLRLPVCPMCHQRAWRPAPPTFRGRVGAWAGRSSPSLFDQEKPNHVCN